MNKFPKHEAVVKWAEGELGVTEEPLGSNTGDRIRFYQKHTWLFGTKWPWCGAFVDTGWEVGGGFKLPWPTAGAYDMGNRARKQNWTVQSVDLMVPGDIVVWNIGSGHVSIFIGYNKNTKIVHTIDGNVSDMVAHRERPLSLARDLIHVPENAVISPAKYPVFQVVSSESGHKVLYVSGITAIQKKLPFLLKHNFGVTIKRKPRN